MRRLTQIFLYQTRTPHGRFCPDYPVGFPPSMQVYYWYANAFNFPPEVVDKLTIEQDHWFRMMKLAQEAAQEILSDEQQRQMEREMS